MVTDATVYNNIYLDVAVMSLWIVHLYTGLVFMFARRIIPVYYSVQLITDRQQIRQNDLLELLTLLVCAPLSARVCM